MADRQPPKFDTYTDLQTAEGSLAMARSIRDESGIRDTSTSLGKLINVAIPVMASQVGMDLTQRERSSIDEWESDNRRPLGVAEAKSAIRDAGYDGRKLFGSGHPMFREKGIVNELAVRAERRQDRDRPVDRQTDIVLVAGLPDRAMAARTLEHARDLRQGAAITERDGAVGEMLNRIVPLMAHKLGVPIDDHEQRVIMEHSRKSEARDMSPRENVEDMSRTIMFASRDGARIFPDSALFRAPERGNLAAVMFERMLRQENIPSSTRDDGSTEVFPFKDGESTWIDSVNGPQAVGTHMLAKHLLVSTKEMGHHPMPAWSPGHLVPPRDGGRFADMIPKEAHLGIASDEVYRERLSRLPDAELAAELVEQARDMRERRPEVAIKGQGGYHRFVTNYTIPEMGTLYGQTMRPEEVNPHPIKRDTDQQMFEGVSSAIYHSIAEGQHYVIREGLKNPNEESPSLSERAMFGDVTSGNSMGMLLDRIAVTLEVERGGEYDRMGRQMAEVAGVRGQGSGVYAWKPGTNQEVSLRGAPSSPEPAREADAAPALERDRTPARGAMAAAFAAAGMSRGG